ncbi:MAG: carbohydrate ABC transporter permease [Spirochaetales bacterium]|nr:carbohydrate ABC transporter permease [Spirochaetales bacterium]
MAVKSNTKRSRLVNSFDRAVISHREYADPAVKTAFILVFIFLSLLAVTTIFPIYWMFTGGVKSSTAIAQVPPQLIPEAPQWGNFLKAWGRLNYSLYFLNTSLLCLGALVLQYLISATAAFSLSKLNPVLKKFWLAFFLTTLMVPPNAYLIPQYLTIVRFPVFGFSLLDNWLGVLLPMAVSAFNIFLLKSFFDDIPGDLVDAARIDGANAWFIYLKIMIPLSKAVLAVISIFTIVGTWKEFFWPFLVLKKTSVQPIMVALYRLTSQTVGEPLNLVVAGMAIASLPPLILFFIFQKQILQGISLTGIKG